MTIDFKDLTKARIRKGRLIIRVHAPDEKIGTIVLPDAAQVPKDIADVVKAGPDCLCQPGDTILFDRHLKVDMHELGERMAYIEDADAGIAYPKE